MPWRFAPLRANAAGSAWPLPLPLHRWRGRPLVSHVVDKYRTTTARAAQLAFVNFGLVDARTRAKGRVLERARIRANQLARDKTAVIALNIAN